MASPSPSNNYYYYGVPSTSTSGPDKLDMLYGNQHHSEQMLFNNQRYGEQNRQYDDLMKSQADQTAQILAGAQLDAQGVTYRDDLNTTAIKGAIERNASMALDATYRAALDAQKIGSDLNSTTERVGSQLSSAIERTGAAALHGSEVVGAQLSSAIERTGAQAVHASEIANAQLGGAVTTATENIVSTTNRNGFEAINALNRSTNEIMAGLRAGEDNVHRLGSALSAGQIEERGFLGNNFSHISDELSRNWQSATAQSAKTDYLIAEKAGHLNNHLSEVKHHVAKDVWKSSSILGREFDRRHEWQMRELYHLDKHQDKNTEKIRRAGSEHFAATNLQIAKSEALLAQQAASNFGKAQLDLCKTENAIQLQAANNYANIQLEALKNKEQLAKQMAECCCEIKELVITTSGTTQDVVKNAETERLRDSLRSLETQNMILSVHNGGPGRR